ncbi:MAG TPA: glycosyltransferase family 4 protein [Gemmatimonadales bacterium]|nr:glycosyltransferase family 4 protein [Gemmatimonadales bacterium]
MPARPRLLFLTQSLPFPPHTGVAGRNFNILKQLGVEFDVDLVAFSRVNHQVDGAARERARDALRRVVAGVAEPTPIPSEHSVARKFWDHARSVMTGRAYTYYEYDSPSFASRLRTVLRTRTPELVHVDSLDLHRWLPELPPVPIACTHHNIESDLLRRQARWFDRAPLRRYLLFQANRIEQLERDLCPRFALNVMMSDLDAQRLLARASGAVTAVVPNGTDTAYYEPRHTASVPGRVVFVGPTYSYANWDAVEFLLQEIWPRIRATDRSTSLQLIGRAAPPDQARYDAEPGVTALGYVPDMRPPVSEARCCVVPIRIGGGTRLKILDAWAMGKAVVSTSIGCEGLEVVEGENILVRDAPDAFAEAVLEVLRDAALRTRLERAARRTAVETYSWSVVGQRIRSAYNELLSRPDSSSALDDARTHRRSPPTVTHA